MHENTSVVLKLHLLPLDRRQCLAFVSLLIFFLINLLWSSFIIFLWSYFSGKCLFLLFCFSTTWSLLLLICKYVLQSNVKLMVSWWKYTFQRVLVLDAYFYCYVFWVYYQGGFVEARAEDGLLEIFGPNQGWHASFVMFKPISAKHIAQVRYQTWKSYCLCYRVKFWLLKC